MNKILIYGAYGSLGRGIVKHFHKMGLALVLAGRNMEKLKELEEYGEISCFNLEGPILSNYFKGADTVIYASGLDIRKPLINQSLRDIDTQLESNLLGPIRLVKSFIEFSRERDTSIDFQALFLGGFGDGSWATPYYSVDVASRSGLYSFIQSMNIELKEENIKLKYFCPLPADTIGERPYHKLWKSQGVKIVTPEEVAISINRALNKDGDYLMGGLSIKLVYRLKAMFPGLINRLLLIPLGFKTMQYIDGMEV